VGKSVFTNTGREAFRGIARGTMRAAAAACAVALVFASFLIQAPSRAYADDAANTLILELKNGKVKIKLLPEVAPKHVERVKKLVADGFYNGITFHRVIDGFMAQTGDPTGTGQGGSSYPDLPAEFSTVPFRRGTIGAARTSDPNSANSQFFICLGDPSHLTGKYTAWGEVVDGMQYVDMIAKGEPPANPDVIVKMYMAAADAGN
jgi:peptidylprolyl isomerase